MLRIWYFLLPVANRMWSGFILLSFPSHVVWEWVLYVGLELSLCMFWWYMVCLSFGCTEHQWWEHAFVYLSSLVFIKCCGCNVDNRSDFVAVRPSISFFQNLFILIYIKDLRELYIQHFIWNKWCGGGKCDICNCP